LLGLLAVGSGLRRFGFPASNTEIDAATALHCVEIDVRIVRWDNPTMILTLDAKRRLTVPAGLAPASPGDAFEARFDAEENEIIFRRIAGAGDWLAVLSECPVSMDDLPRRRRETARRRRI
jgi:hypothetical protein